MVAVAASSVSANSAFCFGSAISAGEFSRPIVRLRLPFHKSDSFCGDAKLLQLKLPPAFISAFEESDCQGDIGSDETIRSRFRGVCSQQATSRGFLGASSVC